MGQLKNVVRLSETDYSTLLNGGSVTKGGKTYTLDANTLYVVEDETPPAYAQRSDYASEAGRAHGADCASRDADGNNIVDTYATKDDVDAALSEKANKSATVSAVGYDTTNKKLTKTINGTTSDVVTASTVVTDGGGYKKPSTGIPKTDLASAVQTSLGKADTALQSHQDISGKANLASPTFTGTPKAPTAASGTNTTQIATTAFVQNAVEAKSMMITAAENAYSDTAGQRVIPFSSPNGMAGIYGAILQWTAQPNRLPSDGNPSWYFQLLARSNGDLYFRSRINGENWSSFRLLAFRRDLNDYAKTSDLPGDASTSQKGIVQLSGTINSDNAKAATPAAVNDALTAFAQQVQSRINEAVAGKADKSATVSAVGYDTTNKKLTKTINGTTSDVVTASTIVTDGGGYKKPSTGIPKTDLASAVQTSLGKADTALQSHQDITLKDSGDGATGQRDLYVDAAAAGTIVTSFTPGSAQRPFVAPSWRAMLLRLSGKADKTDSLIVKRSTENNGVDFNMPDGSDNALYYVHTDYTQQNKPQQYGMLLNLCISAGHIQLFSDIANHLWFRTYWWTTNPEGFTYPSWMRIPTMGEVVTPSGLNTALANYAKTSDLDEYALTSDLTPILAKTDKIYFADFTVEGLLEDSVSSTVLSGFETVCRAMGDGAVLVIPCANNSVVATADTSASSSFSFAFVYKKKYYEVQRNASNVWSVVSTEYAPKASPTLTGTPKAPTAAAGTNTTQIATTAFVQSAVNNRMARYSLWYPDNSDNAQRWKKIGSYTTGGDGSAFVIEIFGGNGYNASWYQNTAVRIMIKDGYQTTKAAAESVGITVEKFITDNVDYEVAVVASSDTQGDVWIKVSATYIRYDYIVYGGLTSWAHNSSFTAANFTTTAPSHNQKKVEYIDYLKGQTITTWVSRNNFTEAQWTTYAATAHEESWATSLKHGLKKGDYFAVTGQATDTKNYHTAIYRCDEPGGSGVNPHGKCIRHYNASTPEDAFGLTFRLALNTHVFQSSVTDTGNNFISITALMCDGAGVETLYSAGKIVIKDSTGTVRSTWTNKCYATFSGSGFMTFANYSGPFTVELQNASGTVLTSTQIFKV